MVVRAFGSVVAAFVALAVVAVGPASGQDVPTCEGVPATIVGTEGNDRINGTPGDDVIVGLGGRDRIAGGAGNDLICGGEGIDIIKGQRGRDRIFGGPGKDRVFGNSGRDVVDGGPGRDKVFGGGGLDTITGGPGNDIVNGGPAADSCDLDRNDRFNLCESGDVVGGSGSADASVAIPVDASFAASTAPFGGATREYHVMEFILDGPSAEDPMSISVYDADDTLIEFYTERTDSYRGEVLVTGRPARVEVAASGGTWEVVFKHPSLLARSPRSTTGEQSRVFFLADPAVDTTTAVLSLSPDTSGNVIVQAAAPGVLADLFVNEVYPHPEGFNQWTGAVRPGVRLVAVEVDFGRWALDVTD